MIGREPGIRNEMPRRQGDGVVVDSVLSPRGFYEVE